MPTTYKLQKNFLQMGILYLRNEQSSFEPWLHNRQGKQELCAFDA